jgi:bacteriocin biosynthesis cyclodehydratase domain-containing protein
MLDGTREIEQIRSELNISKSYIDGILTVLNENGLLQDSSSESVLTEAESNWWRHQTEFFSHFSVAANPELSTLPDVLATGSNYQLRLRSATVALFGCGRLGSQVARDLSISGVGRLLCIDDGEISDSTAFADAWYDHRHVGRPRATTVTQLVEQTSPLCRAEPLSSPSLGEVLDQCDIAVLAHDAFRPDDYEALNLAALSARTPWTSCRLVGFEVLVGPTVLPTQSACWTCFEARRYSHLTRYEEASLAERAWGEVDTPPSLAVAPGVSFLSLEVVKLLTGFAPAATLDALLAIDLLSTTATLHPVLRLPRCRACGRATQPRPTEQIWDVWQG